MGRDVEIADARAIGQRHRDRWFQAALSSAGFEKVRDGAGAERITLEGAVDRRTQFLRPVVTEQREEPRSVHAERFAPGTASRSRSRALDGLFWRVAATSPATWASCSMLAFVS